LTKKAAESEVEVTTVKKKAVKDHDEGHHKKRLERHAKKKSFLQTGFSKSFDLFEQKAYI
jgi:hypothetical protein